MKDIKHIVAIGKALSDSTRVNMLMYVREKGELSCQELSTKFTLSQPTFSHHARKLIDAGLMTVKKQGVSHIYSVNESFLKAHGIKLDKLLQL